MMKDTTIAISIVCILTLSGLQAQTHDHGQMSYELKHRGRIYWQMPRRVLEEIGVREGMRVADLACGDGYFTLILAEKVGMNGKVFAEDIDADALRILKERQKKEGIENISIIHGEPDDPMLPEGEIELILIVNSIHFIENIELFFSHVRRSLTPDGRLVIVQWAAEKMESEMPGWSVEDREKYTLRTNLKRINEAQFDVVELLDFLPMQHIFICQPAQ